MGGCSVAAAPSSSLGGRWAEVRRARVAWPAAPPPQPLLLNKNLLYCYEQISNCIEKETEIKHIFISHLKAKNGHPLSQSPLHERAWWYIGSHIPVWVN